jgi:class 3 adenylate cyclase
LHIILVTDIAGSSAIIEHLGDARAYELLCIHNTIIRTCLRRHHGAEVTHTGDGIEASFASAARAVACAIAIQRAFARHNRGPAIYPLRVRIGINAGEPIPTEGRLFGTAVHTTFYLCSQAQPEQILTAEVIPQLATGKRFSYIDRGPLTLKGSVKQMRVYEVQWKKQPASF